jgi:hypothetical protein
VSENEKPVVETPMDSEKGKEVIENLLKTLPPEEAKKLQDALNSPTPPHIHIDENQNVLIGEAADQAVEMRKQSRKVTKIDEKRAQIFEERVKRWVNNNQDKLKGLNEQQVREQAIHALHAEDLDKMSPMERVKRLEQIAFQTFNKLATDLSHVEGNQFALADAMDVNFRAMAKMFAKLGIPVEDHNKFMEESKVELEAERKAMIEERKQRMMAQQKIIIESKEKKGMVEEAKVVAAETGKEPEGAPIPKDATVFGG